MWEYDKDQIKEGGILIDTEAGRGKDTKVEWGIYCQGVGYWGYGI